MSKAASAVAPKRAMAGQARVFAGGVRLYVEGGNPRPPARRAYASERERRSSEK